MKDQGKTKERRIPMQPEWESIFQAIGQPALVLDPQHRIIAANRATFKAVGKTEEELLAKRCYRSSMVWINLPKGVRWRR